MACELFSDLVECVLRFTPTPTVEGFFIMLNSKGKYKIPEWKTAVKYNNTSVFK